MSESLEAFVNKLQAEGVDAGRKAAEAIRREAREDADAILAEARREADEIVAEARAQGRKIIAKARTEMELAVRDALLKLQRTLAHILSQFLTARTEKELSDPVRLGEILREVIAAYAAADARQEHPFEISLSQETRHKLDRFLSEDLLKDFEGDQKVHVRETLKKAGFEYRIHGGTVEVTAESVAEVLFDMIDPGLHELMEKILAEQNDGSGEDPAPSPNHEAAGER